MTSPYWAKLWIEILDDPKVANMPDWLFRKFIYFVLAAKEYDQSGLLQPVNDLAWRIRATNEDVTNALGALDAIGVVRETADGWILKNFVKRQERDYSNTPEALRQRKHREKERDKKALQRHSDTSVSVSVSDSISNSVSVSDSLIQPNIFKLYENTIGSITLSIRDKLLAAENDYNENWIKRAFEISAERNKRSWSYVHAILERWKREGYDGGKKNGRAVDRTSDEAIKKYGEWENV